MTFNSQVIIQDIRTDFEKMLDYVTEEQARTATADATERGLFKMLIEMGLKLLGWKQGLLRLRIAFVFFIHFANVGRAIGSSTATAVKIGLLTPLKEKYRKSNTTKYRLIGRNTR